MRKTQGGVGFFVLELLAVVKTRLATTLAEDASERRGAAQVGDVVAVLPLSVG